MATLYRYKLKIKEKIRDILGESAASLASRDHHARRPPRHCGMTIHTGIGCNMGCIYCYIRDMGFPLKPKEYPLTPLQLVYALATNPYVVPQRTLAAYGSVTEPFLLETREKALAYMIEVGKWLQLPSQVSTKQRLTDHIARKLRMADPRFSILVSVSSWDEWARKLEPAAPPPSERIEAARIAVEQGLHVSLFIRPIIPGITERDAEKLIRAAAEAGFHGVVLGSLRVTPDILRRLQLSGVDIALLEKRVAGRLEQRRQVPLKTHKEKSLLRKIADEYGLDVYPAACSANIIAHNEGCNACTWGPCGTPEKVSEEDIVEMLALAGFHVDVKIDGSRVLIYSPNREKTRGAARLIESAARLRAYTPRRTSKLKT